MMVPGAWAPPPCVGELMESLAPDFSLAQTWLWDYLENEPQLEGLFPSLNSIF